MAIVELHWSAQIDYPVLSLLQLIPLAACGLLWSFRREPATIWLGRLAAGVELALAIDLYRHFDGLIPALQFAERMEILAPLVYHAGADGITVLFVLLTALLILLVVICGPIGERTPSPRFMAVVFASEAVLMSLFTSTDLLWFVLVSGIQLALAGYLLWRWASSPAKDLALARYLRFMGVALTLLLGGALTLGWGYADAGGGDWSFELTRLSSVQVAPPAQSVVFFLLFCGLAIRTPLFPFHGWLPLAAEHGNLVVAPTVLLGLKVGVYALLRFVFPLLPQAVERWDVYVVGFALTGVLYAAILAMLQENLRRLLAFAVLSHTGVLVIGLFSLSREALQGAAVLSLNFGLAIAGLLFMTGFVLRRTGTMLLSRMGGLFDRIPLVGVTFFIAGLSITGMPGTPGFDAAHLMMEAAIVRFGALFTIAAALANVAAAGFLLRAFQRAFLSPPKEGGALCRVETASPRENAIAVSLITILLGAGYCSEPWLELVDRTTEVLSERYDAP